ncbi:MULTISPECIES: phage tail protein [Paenibacillus]|uniref:phage tail protein n=1 Tax=Paenibacillus TaxID=44249 RepID=UPI0003F50870|nr:MULTISPECIES: phage tail protein [Paenibacillus]UMY55375.1 phage tail protein [Paenibacillus peoriae]
MAIKEPRKFVTTDQGHADVLNIPITTLYENDQALDEAIKNIKVDEATTTVKGIVRLSADYKSTSSVTVPISKALSDLYGISFVDRGKPFSVDWNFITLPGTHRIDVATLNPTSDHSPPGANPKGVLFVGSVKVEEDIVIVHLYVDETGGIYKRIRTAAGVWVPWDGLASKNHTHSASDLPSASTQARGIVQINTSVSSTATDQAAAPIAVKTANDRANEAYNLAQQSLTQAVDLKNKIVGAINGKFGGASSDMSSDQIAAVITNAPVKRFASGNFNGQSATSPGMASGVSLTLSASGLGFTPKGVFFRIELRDTSNKVYLGGTVYDERSFGRQGLTDGGFNNYVNAPWLTPQSGGFTIDVASGSLRTGGGGSQAVLKAYEWFAYE